MTVITQLTPTSDTINGDATGFYVNQINVSGVLTPPATFITLVQSSALFISSSGAVATTGTLESGTFTTSGSMSDAGGNTGTWTFTLTVVGIPSAQVTLVPQIPVPPNGAEIAIPFQIDPATGALAVLTSYEEIIEQHVVTIILTGKTERLMMPSYGSPLNESLFESISSTNNALLAKDIQSAIVAWEPAVHIAFVKISANPQSLTELDISVSYSISPSDDVNTMTVTTGGTIAQVNSP